MAPAAVMKERKQYDSSFAFDDLPDVTAWARGDRIAVQWVRVRRAGESADIWELNNQNLLELLETGQIKAIRNDARFFDGTVNLPKTGGKNTTLRIDFDDGARRTINITNQNSVNYMPAEGYMKIEQ